ncbi:MAG: LysM peptidoglycan-binding domain-containing protein [Anaerolineae bacterium]
MGGSKGRWVSLIIVLVLVNYLVISGLFNLVNKRSQILSATPTRTPKPTFTPNAEAWAFATATPSPQPATATPTSVGLSTPTRPLQTPTISPTPALTKHVVQADETLLDIAIRYRVSSEEILRLNKIQSPDLIFAGQELLIPTAPTPTPTATAGTSTPGPSPTATVGTPAPSPTAIVHVVQPGDTLLDISYRYRADLREIRRLNHLQSDWIYVGQRLIIPNPAVVPDTGPTPTPVPGRRHTVRPGETLSGIAWRYGVSMEAIMAANGLTNPDVIYIGQVLIIPGP